MKILFFTGLLILIGATVYAQDSLQKRMITEKVCNFLEKEISKIDLKVDSSFRNVIFFSLRPNELIKANACVSENHLDTLIVEVIKKTSY